MGTLEEKIRELAEKGELIHLSVIATGGVYRCIYSSSKWTFGYATHTASSIIEAIEGALKAKPVATAPTSPPDTAAVTDANSLVVGAGEIPPRKTRKRISRGRELDPARGDTLHQEKTGALASDWTKP